MAIAQFNWAKIKYSLDDERMNGFLNSLNSINLMADESKGFIWRYKDENNNSMSANPLGDEYIVNLSVWESVEDLRNYVYQTGHAFYLQKKRLWFIPEPQSYILWECEDDYIPNFEEAMKMREIYLRDGSNERVFDFRYSRV